MSISEWALRIFVEQMNLLKTVLCQLLEKVKIAYKW